MQFYIHQCDANLFGARAGGESRGIVRQRDVADFDLLVGPL